jgi:autotransporter-associated beta strand protein
MRKFVNKKSILGTLTAFLLLGSSGVSAVPLPNGDGTWNGVTSSDVNVNTDPTMNWDTGYPNPGFKATFPGSPPAANATPTLSGTASYSSVAFTGTQTVTITGASAALTISTAAGSDATTGNTGTFSILNGTTGTPASLSNTGAASGGAAGTGTVNYNMGLGVNNLTLGLGQVAGLANVTMIAGNTAAGAVNTFTTSTALTLNEVNSLSATDSIVLGGVLTLGDANNQTIAGVITETAAAGLNKVGAGKLTLTNDDSALTGTSTVAAGELNLNTSATKLGSAASTVNVTGGKLTGIGTLAGTVNLNGGTIKPGNSPGIMTVGTYNANTGTHLVEIQGQNNVPGVNNSELIVTGVATLTNGAAITVQSNDGGFFIGGDYVILQAGTLTGAYSPVVTTNTTLTPDVIYDYANNRVLLDYQAPFFACADSANGQEVALQLFTITNPNAQEAVFLNAITSLTCPDIGIALDELSGARYAEFLGLAELSTHQFTRRLYDPVRQFLAKDPCACCDPYDCCNQGIEVWVEGGGSQFRVNRSHHHHSDSDGDSDDTSVSGAHHGFKSNGWQVSAGIQMASNTDWLIGAALCYEHTTLDFGHDVFSNGFENHHSGNTKTIFGALYGAYRMCDFYVMGDLVLGGSQGELKRDYFIGTDEFFGRAKPEAFQGILYAELGYDFRYCSFVVTPFLGLEGGYYSFKKFGEGDDFVTNLHFKERSYGTFDTRLGVHLIADDLCSGLFVGVDLAWQYRCTENNNFFDANFVGLETDFRTHGSRLDPNSFEAALNIEQSICDGWSVFASGYWQQWSRANAWDLLAGVSYAW